MCKQTGTDFGTGGRWVQEQKKTKWLALVEKHQERKPKKQKNYYCGNKMGKISWIGQDCEVKADSPIVFENNTVLLVCRLNKYKL